MNIDMPVDDAQALRRLLDEQQIRDAMSRYARGVDRGDWDLVRSAYHPDAHDEHGDYKGGIDGFIDWLDARFAGADNSMHFLGQMLVEFRGPDIALVETYFVSRRLSAPGERDTADTRPGDALAREAWGRYVDRFERRAGAWKVAHRTVVLEALSTALAIGGQRVPGRRFGRRDRGDRLYEVQREIFGE
jgi:hypothetical protein